MVEPPQWYGVHPGALLGTIAIGAFHMHHFVFFEFTFEDVVHHLGNAGGVVIIGMCCPWNKGLSLANMAMCAVPGGINYFNMWLRKIGGGGGDGRGGRGRVVLMTPRRQKGITRGLNIVLRYPLMLCSLYHFIITMGEPHAPPVSTLTFMTMCFGLFAQCMNALYYADQVVGNYWVYLSTTTATTKTTTSSNTALVGEEEQKKEKKMI